jgi:S1-C subfamily serine protease
VAVIAGVIGALAASGIGMISGAWVRQTTVVRPVIPATPAVSLAFPGAAPVDWASINDQIAPSVVGISVSGMNGPQYGSGLLLFHGGGSAYVVTASTLFSAGEEAAYVGPIEVISFSGTQAKGHLLGQDPLSGLAVISVADSPKQTFPALGSVASLRVANQVMAVGARTAPGGTILAGQVSNLDQEVTIADGADMDNLVAVSTPTISASVAGGPLVDDLGDVVGITLSLDPSDANTQALTFAVPIDEVVQVARQMVAGGAVTHPWLGITSASDLTSPVAHQEGLAGGAQVGAVASPSPASRLGIKASDIIFSFDGRPVTSTGSLISLLDASSPGLIAPISYIHDGKTIATRVQLANEPADS